MSVNITVNGKFAGHCRPHPLLADPEVVRKAEEKERRKQRLLQVREESKKLAKKIRDEVNEEKKRELEKLQATKERELECWRQHALQNKREDYRAAIFQIGMAHEAAKRENEAADFKKKQQRGSYKDFKKQMVARKCQPGKVQFSCQPYYCACKQVLPGASKQVLPGASKQFKCTCTQTEEYSSKKNEEAPKRKRDYSLSSSESECEDEGYKEQTTLPQSSISLSSTCDTTMSSSTNNPANQTTMFVPTKNKCLIKTPAVYLDVEVGTDDSVTVSAPAEVQDKHVGYSRQFTSIIRVSPRKGRQQKENTCENASIQQSSTTTTLSSDTIAKEQQNKSCLEKNRNQHTNVQVSKEKRFTIISELVKKQQQNEGKADANSRVMSCPLNSQTISTIITPQLSPKKQSRGLPNQAPIAVPAQSPRKTSATSKSSRTATTQPLTSFTATNKANSAAISSSSSCGRVQFYDYNSKLAKEQDQAATKVGVQRQRDQSQPSAMQQAAHENQKERDRLLEELKKCQITEERGQKALEREQIRRDCNELTEKLEVLSREYANQLPSNETQLHIFADKQLRKEGKMNTAIEKLLQRPSIITCPEQNKPIDGEVTHKSPTNEENLGNLLNVASLNNKVLPTEDVSSDSCCSILLGYVDDQSRLVKQDLQNNEATQNHSKQKRLKNLLKRLDQLRNSLIEELRNKNESKSDKRKKENPQFSSKEENLRQLIDGISEMRKEREQIFINENSTNTKQLREREKELEAKEALLDRKVREFYELQKQDNKSQNNEVINSKRNKSEPETDEISSSSDKNKGSEKEKIVCASGGNPLEIIITVKGDTKCVKIPQKPKRKKYFRKSPSKLSTLIKSPQTSLTKAKNYTPKKKAQATKLLAAKNMLGNQNSYDSNSTSYMSLPPELHTKVDDLAERVAKNKSGNARKEPEMMNTITSNQDQQQESEISLESVNNMPRSNPPPHINPLIAQYVHRLLGMPPKAVQLLGVSSSDIETPASSIINITDNVNKSDIIISDERLTTLHNFIEENKSFIKDIEQSIRSQNNTSLENSMRMLDDIWRKRLEAENKEAQNSKKIQDVKKKQQTDKLFKDKKMEQKSCLNTKEKKPPKSCNATNTTKSVPSKGMQMKAKTTHADNVLKDLSKSLSSHYSTDDKESTRSLNIYKRPVEAVDKAAINAKLSTDTSKSESGSQMARYAKLTENCTHRIAELTELINRVREEKQRILEVTLSSVSDNGRHSTEYLELPEGTRTRTRNEQDDLTRASSSSEETTQNKQSRSTNSLHEMPKLSSADKTKNIANSRDSGIAESRPITALENRIDQEPLSQTSSESTMPQGVRKMKPPPTLKRFSPQLPEDELAHELSTIFEVDTPATSRINTAVGGLSAEEIVNAGNNELQQPVKFPTFDQYIKQLDLDITHLSPEQSIQLQQEFSSFLECLQQNRFLSADSPKYLEFPSINAYIQQLAESDLHIGETLEESLRKLHISGLQAHTFPAVREYIRHNKSKSLPSDEQQLLDTASLENITDAQTRNNTDNDTDSIDIQEELKKRKIIKNSFNVIETKKQHIFSSTARRDEAFYENILAGESGMDKLSTSGNTSDLLDTDLKRMVQQLPGEVRKKTKDVKILSSSTTSTDASAIAYSALRAASLDKSSKDTGRAFNLRDFLTRELEKLANHSVSTSNSSTDDSLRSHFLHSLIGSLTPHTNGAASKSGAHTLDRQKTSTPVPMQSSQARSTASSNSSSQLFSGESRLSSVHYHDRSIRITTSEDANADQSSG